MSYLLDTDTCIYWLNGRQSVKIKLLAAGWEQVAVSVITQAENLKRADDFVKQLPIFPLSEAILKQFGALKTQRAFGN
jgi:tRNA(fMet)-specific endonuclease VapC